MCEKTLLLLKEKILKTDAVINLVAEKNCKIEQLQLKLKFLFGRYVEKSREAKLLQNQMNVCKNKYEPLKLQVSDLENQNSDLRARYDSYLSSTQMQFKSNSEELKAVSVQNKVLVKMNAKLNKSLSTLRLNYSKEATMSVKIDEIDLLKTENNILSNHFEKLMERCETESRELQCLRAQQLKQSDSNKFVNPSTELQELKKKHAAEILNMEVRISKMEGIEQQLRKEIRVLKLENGTLKDRLGDIQFERNLLDNSLEAYVSLCKKKKVRTDSTQTIASEEDLDCDVSDVESVGNFLKEMIDLPNVLTPFSCDSLSCYNEVDQDLPQINVTSPAPVENKDHCFSVPNNFDGKLDSRLCSTLSNDKEFVSNNEIAFFEEGTCRTSTPDLPNLESPLIVQESFPSSVQKPPILEIIQDSSMSSIIQDLLTEPIVQDPSIHAITRDSVTPLIVQDSSIHSIVQVQVVQESSTCPIAQNSSTHLIIQDKVVISSQQTLRNKRLAIRKKKALKNNLLIRRLKRDIFKSLVKYFNRNKMSSNMATEKRYKSKEYKRNERLLRLKVEKLRELCTTTEVESDLDSLKLKRFKSKPNRTELIRQSPADLKMSTNSTKSARCANVKPNEDNDKKTVDSGFSSEKSNSEKIVFDQNTFDKNVAFQTVENKSIDFHSTPVDTRTNTIIGPETRSVLNKSSSIVSENFKYADSKTIPNSKHIGPNPKETKGRSIQTNEDHMTKRLQVLSDSKSSKDDSNSNKNRVIRLCSVISNLMTPSRKQLPENLFSSNTVSEDESKNDSNCIKSHKDGYTDNKSITPPWKESTEDLCNSNSNLSLSSVLLDDASLNKTTEDHVKVHEERAKKSHQTKKIHVRCQDFNTIQDSKPICDSNTVDSIKPIDAQPKETKRKNLQTKGDPMNKRNRILRSMKNDEGGYNNDNWNSNENRMTVDNDCRTPRKQLIENLFGSNSDSDDEDGNSDGSYKSAASHVIDLFGFDSDLRAIPWKQSTKNLLGASDSHLSLSPTSIDDARLHKTPPTEVSEMCEERLHKTPPTEVAEMCEERVKKDSQAKDCQAKTVCQRNDLEHSDFDRSNTKSPRTPKSNKTNTYLTFSPKSPQHETDDEPDSLLPPKIIPLEPLKPLISPIPLAPKSHDQETRILGRNSLVILENILLTPKFSCNRLSNVLKQQNDGERQHKIGQQQTMSEQNSSGISNNRVHDSKLNENISKFDEKSLDRSSLTPYNLRQKNKQYSQSFKRPNCMKRLKTSLTPELTSDDKINSSPPKKSVKKMSPCVARYFFKRILNFGNEGTIVDEVARKFIGQKEEHVTSMILSELVLYSEDVPDTKYTPPAPVLTQTQRHLLGFMCKLDGSYMPGLLDCFLCRAERTLLTQIDLVHLDPIARLYLGVCKLRKDLDRMRRMICDALYFMGDFAVPFLFTVLSTWIEVLPLQIDSIDDSLVKVIIQVINTKTCVKGGYNLFPLRKLLNDYYGYPLDRWNSDEVFEEIFQKYLDDPSLSRGYAILLLCKNSPTKWVLRQVNTRIKAALMNSKNVCIKARILSLTERITNRFKCDSDKTAQKDVEATLKMFGDGKIEDLTETVIKESG